MEFKFDILWYVKIPFQLLSKERLNTYQSLVALLIP